MRFNQEQAGVLAERAAACRDEGRFDQAESLYRQAVALADPGAPETPGLHAAYAFVLSSLHLNSDAATQYERALHLEIRRDNDESRPAVFVARYFLGEHYLRMGDQESARRAVAPSLEASGSPLAWIVEAQAVFLAGDVEQARAAADRAVQAAEDESQRETIRERLAEIWS